MKNLFIYYLVVFYLRVVKLTTLWDVINKGDKDNANLFIVWHNRTLICLLGIDKVVGNDKLNSIVSPSKDGKFLSDLMASFGHKVILSSQESGTGMKGLKTAISLLNQGKKVVITPDGSRGPRYHLKKGTGFILKKSASRYYIFSLNFKRRILMNSWDRMIIPTPFNRGVIMGEYFDFDDSKSVDELNIIIEKKLIELSVKADKYFNHKPIERA